VLDRSSISIPVKDWAAFEAWVQAPAKAVPALSKLAHQKPVWQAE
jgi:uncharacterized protein (DUF1778 family)